MNIPFVRTVGDRPQFGKRRDCAVIALSNALGCSYFEAERFWADNGRKLNRGTFVRRILGKEKIVLNHKIQLVFEYKFNPYSHVSYGGHSRKGISLNQFLLRKSKGTFLCCTRNHAFCVKDGIVLSAQPEKGRGILTEIWQVEKLGNESIPVSINVNERIVAPVVKPKSLLESKPWLKQYLND